MSREAAYTLKDDKQELHKQLGCMNGLFQLFDRRYLLGQRRHGHRHKNKPQGESSINKEPNNASEKHPNTVTKEKHRVSVESSRHSFSSSCSSLDCSKRVQTESSSFCPSNFSEPSSPTLNKKPELSVPLADIRDVVKDSMTRKPRVVSVKTVAKDGRKGPTMTHVDSPRPLLQCSKTGPYERKDQNLAKGQETSTLTLTLTSRKVKEFKDMSRYSCDGRESSYKLKSASNVKERPRLSLDSKQSSLRSRTNAVDQSQSQSQIQSNEPGSNKRLPTSVVARLMGLEVLKSDSLKIKPCVDQSQTHESTSTSVSRISRKPGSPRVSNALTRIPLEPAPWKQEVKQPVNKKARDGCQSVYGQIERRLTEVEFKTSGKDLRALKQILEAIQRTKMRLESTEPEKTVVKPDNVASESILTTNLQKVKKVNPGRGQARHVKPTETKAARRNKETDCNSRSPRLQKSKIKKQSNGKPSIPNSKTKDQPHNELGDTVSFPSESDASVGSHNEPEVTSKDWTQEYKNKFAERLMGYKQMAEQPSPVSVLDAFFTEDTPSPVKKKSYAFKDNEDLCFDEREWNQVRLHNSVSSCSTELTHVSPGFSNIHFDNIKQLVNQNELLDTNEDHAYIKEVLTASGNTSDPYDEVISIITEDVNKRTEEWDHNCNEVPALVLDIERLIFKDLISETVNGELSGSQVLHERYRRQLFVV